MTLRGNEKSWLEICYFHISQGPLSTMTLVMVMTRSAHINKRIIEIFYHVYKSSLFVDFFSTLCVCIGVHI